jgi:hypothetical protein
MDFSLQFSVHFDITLLRWEKGPLPKNPDPNKAFSLKSIFESFFWKRKSKEEFVTGT